MTPSTSGLLCRASARHLTLTAAIVICTLVLCISVGILRAQQQFTRYDIETAEGMLSQVHDVLKHKYYDSSFHGIDIDERYKSYVEQVKNARSVQAAYRIIEAYLVGLNDSHTLFIPPPNANHVAYDFRFKMIGDRCFIVEVRPGSDAAKKLHPGDQVLKLDGYNLNRNDLWQLEYYLYRLPPRLTTDFTLRGISGQERQESVTAEFQAGRAFMDLNSGDARFVRDRLLPLSKSRSAEAGEVLIWKFPVFNGDEGTVSHMVGEARRYKALVLDLRGNPGGLETTLLFMLGHFFDHDVTVGNKIMRKDQKLLVAKSRGHDVFPGQFFVLLDSRSSSAAELFARVVQIEHRGIIIGDRSAGSVMAAQLFPLKEGTAFVIPFAVEITRADLIMTDGKTLEKQGVLPDVTVLPSADDLTSGRDPVLGRAVEMAGGRLDADAAGKMFPYEWPPLNPAKD